MEIIIEINKYLTLLKENDLTKIDKFLEKNILLPETIIENIKLYVSTEEINIEEYISNYISKIEFDTEKEKETFILEVNMQIFFKKKEVIKISKYEDIILKEDLLTLFYPLVVNEEIKFQKKLQTINNIKINTHSNGLNSLTSDSNTGFFNLKSSDRPTNFICTNRFISDTSNRLAFTNLALAKYEALIRVAFAKLDIKDIKEKDIKELFLTDFITKYNYVDKFKLTVKTFISSLQKINSNLIDSVESVNKNTLKTITLPANNTYKSISILHGTTCNIAIKKEISKLNSATFYQKQIKTTIKEFIDSYENKKNQIELEKEELEKEKLNITIKKKLTEIEKRIKDLTQEKESLIEKYEALKDFEELDKSYFLKKECVKQAYSFMDNINFVGGIHSGMNILNQADINFNKNYIYPLFIDIENEELKLDPKSKKQIDFLFYKFNKNKKMKTDLNFQIEIQHGTYLSFIKDIFEKMEIKNTIKDLLDKNISIQEIISNLIVILRKPLIKLEKEKEFSKKIEEFIIGELK